MKHCIRLVMICIIGFYSCKSERPSRYIRLRAATITGRWELNQLLTSTDGLKLFPARRPYITIDSAGQRFAGNTGCNSISGPLDISALKIQFKEPIIMTKMACQGGMEGESIFLHSLHDVNSYILNDSSLSLMKDGQLMMQFLKH
ncbi:MAG: META domain-containing protein [Bacteroidetes bacterium]|nr:META domain-containing protein [Bacteroidota bacterium]